MMSQSLFVFPKTLDLHCVSAYEALSEFMHRSNLISLRRFRYFEFSFLDSHVADSEAILSRIIKESFVLLNSNKESFLQGKLIKPKKEGVFSLVNVTSLVANPSLSIQTYLNQRFDAGLSEFKTSVVWEICTHTQCDVLSEIVVSTSRTAGILSHPLFESAALLSAEHVYA